MTLEGRPLHWMTPRQAIRNGIAFCPEDRKAEGLVLELSVRENIMLGLQSKRSWLKQLSHDEQRRLASEMITTVGIITTDVEKPVGFLPRGACFMVNLNSVPLQLPFVAAFAGANIPFPSGGSLTSSAIVMLIASAVAIFIAHFTRFGTNVYALGGDHSSAVQMGVPVRRTTVMITTARMASSSM